FLVTSHAVWLKAWSSRWQWYWGTLPLANQGSRAGADVSLLQTKKFSVRRKLPQPLTNPSILEAVSDQQGEVRLGEAQRCGFGGLCEGKNSARQKSRLKKFLSRC
ncbi:unnamed protein product, partial [Tenebrio molitor]